MLRRRMSRPLRIVLVLAALLSGGVLAACGSEPDSVPKGTPEHAGSEIFYSHCGGCHTLDVAGTQGGATQVRDRERVDGPNFNQRKETYSQVLYAIRNGGFSGAIMPENIVTGPQAAAVARFLAKYSGSQAHPPPAPNTATSSSGQ